MSFWARFGELSVIDWCEPNYVVSRFVAEWWNSVSSLAIIAVAVIGLVQALRRPQRELRFVLGYVLVGVVGIGSVAFHGTLLRSAQALDELPMVLTGLTYVYVLQRRHDRAEQPWPWLAPLLGAYAASVIVSYFLVHEYFQLFMAAYALIIAYLALASARVVFTEDKRPLMRTYFVASVGSYVGGVFVLWLPEHVWLPCDHPLQQLQLHALFHLTSAVGSYAWLRMMMHHREAAAHSGGARAVC